MAFTDAEKARLRHHMGYPNVSEVSTFQLGVPASVETSYLIETAFNKVLPEGETMCRDLMAKLDIIESQMVGDLELLSVEQVDEIKINAKEMPMLRKEYRYWLATLSNLLMIPVSPNDTRWFGGINVQVRN